MAEETGGQKRTLEEREVEEFPVGMPAMIIGLSERYDINEKYCVSRGPHPESQGRVLVMMGSGKELAVRPTNLKPLELAPGMRVRVAGLSSAAGSALNGRFGLVNSWQGDRWVVALDKHLKLGAPVRTTGLKTDSLNGREGKIITYDEAVARWKVELENGEVKAFRSSNLVSAGPAPEASAPPPSKSPILAGVSVRLQGLKGAAHLNGKTGTVLQWQGSATDPVGRWQIKIDGMSGETKAFKAENLLVQDASNATNAPPVASVAAETKALRPENLIIEDEAVGVDVERRQETEESILEQASKQRKTGTEMLISIEKAIEKDPRTAANLASELMAQRAEVAEKLICCVATRKRNVQVISELSECMTKGQNDGIYRMKLPQKVRGLEGIDAIEECQTLAQRSVKQFLEYVKLNYMGFRDFLKRGYAEDPAKLSGGVVKAKQRMI